MYARGVRCSNCHEPHSASLRAEGNALCGQCHGPAGNPKFPSLRKATYDTPQHHFHQPGSAGAECKSCHMIERVYMGIDARRDHSFRIPRPDLSVLLGTPNACNDCHQDKSAEWAAAEVAKRFPDSQKRGPTFADAFAAAWDNLNQEGTSEELLAIACDQGKTGSSALRHWRCWVASQRRRLPIEPCRPYTTPIPSCAPPRYRCSKRLRPRCGSSAFCHSCKTR